jgi:5-methyltetrahydrofolate--homocysteine methyltransferase
MFILLPLSDKGIPKASAARQKVIKEIFTQAENSGFTKDDIIVDGLALSIASNMEYAEETLKTIEWCAKAFGCNTLVGLSNISFGMPNRKWINAVFLKLARERGLNSAIADPESAKLADKPIVKKIIREQKNNVSAIFNYFLKASFKERGKPLAKNVPVEERISKAVLDGGKESIEGLVKEAIAKGKAPYQIIEGIVIPAIVRAGVLFDKREYFLPQLIASAETVKRAFNYLKPYIKKDTSKRKQKAMILIATVKGDIHDIGKNIVVLILESNGFRVIDLGKDISSGRIISAIKRFKPDIVGLSALMTTTMVKMPEVISLARKEGLKCKFLVGGAVVSKNYAKEIGAEYAHDAIEAVRLAEKIGR